MKKIPKEKYVSSLGPSNKEVERVPSGSTVVFESYDCFSNKIQTTNETFKDLTADDINRATGPLFVEGAEVGDTLKVEILDLEIGDQGAMTTIPNAGAFAKTIDKEETRIIPIKDGKAIFNEHLELPIDPMIGVIGTAAANEDISTGTPGDHGGNLDCKRVQKGATIYLPVNQPGALLSLGDAHSNMGDGELLICGLEIPSVTTVKVTVLKGQEYPLPFLVNDDAVMAIASAETLDEASIKAAENMQSFLVDELKMEPIEAGMFLSAGGDLRVCQVVNPLKTVRVEVPKWVVEKYNYTVK